MSEKKPSGAEFEKRRVAAEKLARKLAAEQLESGVTAAAIKAYQNIQSPAEGAIGGIAYANRAAVVLLQGVLSDPELSEPERRKQAREFIAVIGMTHSKALYEERLMKLERQVGLSSEPSHDDGEAIPAAGGTALRARKRAFRKHALSGSLPGVPSEEGRDDSPEGGGPVGSPDE